MQCPTCGYLLDNFDTNCPRCRALRARGVDPAQARTDPTGAGLITTVTHAPPTTLVGGPFLREKSAKRVAALASAIWSCSLCISAIIAAVGITSWIMDKENMERAAWSFVLGLGIVGNGWIWFTILAWGAELLRTLGRMEDQHGARDVL